MVGSLEAGSAEPIVFWAKLVVLAYTLCPRRFGAGTVSLLLSTHLAVKFVRVDTIGVWINRLWAPCVTGTGAYARPPAKSRARAKRCASRRVPCACCYVSP